MSDQSSLYNSQLGVLMDRPIQPLITGAKTNDPYAVLKATEGTYFVVLFALLLSAMQVRQSTVLTESKEIELNASLQNALNKENASIKFSIAPANATTGQRNQIETTNQQRAALREDIQNSLITARQIAQVMMTQTSTNVDILQQDASENSGLLQTLNIIFKIINEIGKRRGG